MHLLMQQYQMLPVLVVGPTFSLHNAHVLITVSEWNAAFLFYCKD